MAINSLEALFELFSTIADCHEQVAYSVEKHINKRLLSTFLENTFNELDILATHHFIEGVQIESVRILSIGYRDVDLSVQGYVECELQYGSSSDLRHGDGASLNDSFPFTCKFIANVNNPLKPEINMKSLVIDNSSWYE